MYKIVGGDNKEYGPVTAEQVREWVLQNRANANTVVAFEGGPWKPLSTFPEFAELFRGSPAAAAPPPQVTINSVPAGKTNAWAIAGLVCSILAFIPCCCICPVPSILGMIFGTVGLVQIQRTPNVYRTSRTTALMAIVLGIASIIFGIFLFSNPAFQKQMEEMRRQMEQMR